jgi:plastocyanin
MRQAGRAAAALSVLALAGAVALPAGGAAATPKAKSKTVTLKDSFYSPSNFSVKKGTKIVWKWSGANTQTHNVTLKTAPKGVNKSKFRSNNARANFTFKTTLDKPGAYHFECTLHPTTMQADITVKR